MEKAFRERRGDERAGGERASRLSKDRDSCRVAPELLDVSPYPLERRDLIEQPVIPGCAAWRLAVEGGMYQVAERAKAVVDYHDDDTLAREHSPVEVARAARCVASAVDPDHHRPPVVRSSSGGGVHIESEAIF